MLMHSKVKMAEIKDASLNFDDVDHQLSGSFLTIPFLQKLIAELIGVYLIVFVGCGALVVNAAHDKVLSLPGISIAWGLVVMVMTYSVGHISGAHFNPTVSIAFAICKKFPFKEVPAYISAQVLGAILANATLRLIFDEDEFHVAATIPGKSLVQSLILEFMITFLLMFVIFAVVTDTQAIGELAGLAIGGTILLNAMFAGPISGASMNPARTLGSAIVTGKYRGIWIYFLGPTAGAISGACFYDLIRLKSTHTTKSTKTDDPKA